MTNKAAAKWLEGGEQSAAACSKGSADKRLCEQSASVLVCLLRGIQAGTPGKTAAIAGFQVDAANLTDLDQSDKTACKILQSVGSHERRISSSLQESNGPIECQPDSKYCLTMGGELGHKAHKPLAGTGGKLRHLLTAAFMSGTHALAAGAYNSEGPAVTG